MKTIFLRAFSFTIFIMIIIILWNVDNSIKNTLLAENVKRDFLLVFRSHARTISFVIAMNNRETQLRVLNRFVHFPCKQEQHLHTY